MDEKIGTALKSRLQSARENDTFDVNIFLKDEPAADTLAAMDSEETDDGHDRVRAMQELAAASQRGLLSYLESVEAEVNLIDDEVSLPAALTRQSFWINNSVAAEVSLDVLRNILERPDVAYVELSRNVDPRELFDVDESSSEASSKASGSRAQPLDGAAINASRAVRETDGRAPVALASGGAALIVTEIEISESVSVEIEDLGAASGSEATWNVKLIKAPLLWQKGLTGEGVVVAVIDSGVNYDHPDLKSHMWDGGADFPHHGYDFMNDDTDPRDDGNQGGHGTAGAGIVAGNGTSGSRTGVAPEATIMAIRAGNTDRSIWNGLEFAIQHQAQVISMSMTWKFDQKPNNPAWRRACESILAASVLHANSIGNDGEFTQTFPLPFNIGAPGNCPPPQLHSLQTIRGSVSSAISCGSTDDTDSLASDSGRGPVAWESAPFADYPYENGTKQGLIKPDVCAPGHGASSCNWLYPGQAEAQPYRPFSGTSAATPHLGGCLALLAHACRRSGQPIIPARMQEALENTAVRIAGQTQAKENHYGAGRIDVFAAYQYGQGKGWWE
jgi:subtilisin family serine protease